MSRYHNLRIRKERYAAIMAAIINFGETHDYSPSIRDIGELTNIHAPSVVIHWLNLMREDGLIEFEPGIARSIHIPKVVENVKSYLVIIKTLDMDWIVYTTESPVTYSEAYRIMQEYSLAYPDSPVKIVKLVG